LTCAQTKAAFRLLAVMVTPATFARAMAVISLEEILDQLEGYRSPTRHVGHYWVAVFGQPGDGGWGVRIEGHHISVNATVVQGEVTLTPLFLGANPGRCGTVNTSCLRRYTSRSGSDLTSCTR
jgi:hypothetical protein